MSKTNKTEKEVQAEVRAELEELARPPFWKLFMQGDGRGTHGDALRRLHSQSYIADPFDRTKSTYMLTPAGWDYLERLRLGPFRYWLKNRKPAVIGVFALLVGIVGVVVRLIW